MFFKTNGNHAKLGVIAVFKCLFNRRF